MAGRTEYITPEGLRVDGRRANELRRIEARMGVLREADGSAYFELGNTKVVAAVYGPREVRRGRAVHDRAVVNCEFSMATFSTGERRKRSKGDKRSLDIGVALKQSFEAVLQTQLFARSQIDIYIQVLQADGGVKAASMNAATLALIDAGIPMRDHLYAASCTFLDGHVLLDTNYVEESAGGPDLTVGLLPHSKKLSFVEMESRVHSDRFELMLDAATEGCKAVHTVLQRVVQERTHRLLEARGT